MSEKCQQQTLGPWESRSDHRSPHCDLVLVVSALGSVAHRFRMRDFGSTRPRSCTLNSSRQPITRPPWREPRPWPLAAVAIQCGIHWRFGGGCRPCNSAVPCLVAKAGRPCRARCLRPCQRRTVYVSGFNFCPSYEVRRGEGPAVKKFLTLPSLHSFTAAIGERQRRMAMDTAPPETSEWLSHYSPPCRISAHAAG
jgi:hypothetical protein